MISIEVAAGVKNHLVEALGLPVYISFVGETRPAMPYVVVDCGTDPVHGDTISASSDAWAAEMRVTMVAEDATGVCRLTEAVRDALEGLVPEVSGGWLLGKLKAGRSSGILIDETTPTPGGRPVYLVDVYTLTAQNPA